MEQQINKKRGKLRAIIICILIFVSGLGAGQFLSKKYSKNLDRTLDPADNPIKIGVLLAMDGRSSELGHSIEKGIKLAHKLTPTILGRPVKLVFFDNKGEKKLAKKLAKTLIEDEKVDCIIGSNSSDIAMAVAKVAESAGVPLLVPSATNPLITANKKYVFRACFVDTFQASAAAFFAIKDLASKTAAIIAENDSIYSNGLAKNFEDNYVSRGGKVVERLAYDRGDRNFAPLIKQAMKAGVDLLYMPANFAEGSLILSQAADMGADFCILASDTMDKSDLIKLKGSAVDNFCFTTFAYSANMAQKLIDNKQKAFNDTWRRNFPRKTPNAFNAIGFDSYNLMLEAIKKSGTAEKDEIQHAFEGIEFDGVTGKLKMNEFHNAEKPVGIVKIINGKQKMTAIIERK